METIEYYGIFNGAQMVTEEGREFDVPENYASKSRLVVGDKLRMFFSEEGMRFKQTQLVERRAIRGTVVRDSETGRLVIVTDEGNKYHFLGASLRYYELEEGDTVVASIPYDGEAEWCAIEVKL